MTSPARAQIPPERDPMMAETLYQSGKELLTAGRAAEACPKLAESHRLDPAGGTVLLLGLCYQQAHQWASAWVALNEAVSLARKDSREDREKRAREVLAVVEAKMSRLTLQIDPRTHALAGVQLRRDGREIPPAAWDTPLPIDPGTHTIEVQAPGHQPWRTTITVGDDRSSPAVAVPPLVATPVAAASVSVAPVVPPVVEARRSPWHSAALAAGVTGVVAVGVGTFFGVRTLSRAHDANERCPEAACNDRGAVSDSQGAARDARLSNLGFGLGAFALGGAVIMYMVGRSDTTTARTALRLTPGADLSPDGRNARASLSLGGSW